MLIALQKYIENKKFLITRLQLLYVDTLLKVNVKLVT